MSVLEALGIDPVQAEQELRYLEESHLATLREKVVKSMPANWHRNRAKKYPIHKHTKKSRTRKHAVYSKDQTHPGTKIEAHL